jgi:tripeptidyl-peptidase-1
VTSVGSTLGIDPERAINFTGGGFSNFFPRPTWQNEVVGTFLNTLPSSFPGVFNRSGRGYPDVRRCTCAASHQCSQCPPSCQVATQGWNFETYDGGELELIGGTSASAPAFASVIAIVNDRLGVLGRPPLGFLNRASCILRIWPQLTCRDIAFLYQFAGPAGAFNDVTTGKNVGISCNSSAVAFNAQEGWDPTTGGFVLCIVSGCC